MTVSKGNGKRTGKRAGRRAVQRRPPAPSLPPLSRSVARGTCAWLAERSDATCIYQAHVPLSLVRFMVTQGTFLVHEVKDCLIGFGVVVAAALQHFPVFKRVFHRNERYVGSLPVPYKEDKAFLSYKPLVVVHSPHAMVESVSRVDKVLGRGVVLAVGGGRGGFFKNRRMWITGERAERKKSRKNLKNHLKTLDKGGGANGTMYEWE